MPVDIDNLKLKLGQLEEYIEDVKKLRSKEEADFAPRSDTLTLAERHIEKACQGALDIANHIIAEEGLGQPMMYRDLGYILAKEKIITDGLARKMEEIAKFRNRLVHEYANLDARIIYEIVHKHIDDLTEFAKQIYSYLKTREKGFAGRRSVSGFAPIILILAVVALAGLIAGAYYSGRQSNKSASISQPTTITNRPTSFLTQIPVASPTSIIKTDETANWKTYNNIDESIMFKYPEDWQAEKTEIFGSRSVTEFKYNNTPLFELTVHGNYNQITGKPYRNLDEFLGTRISKSKEILIDGQAAKLVEDQGDPGHVIPYEEALVFTPDKKSIISLYYENPYYNKPNANKVFDQILSTFKFTE